MPSTRLWLGFLLLFSVACPQAAPEPFDGRIELFFRPAVRDSYFSCGQRYMFGNNVWLEPVDLYLYVHDVRLVTTDGNEHPVEISEDPPFQKGGYALLDFANGMPPCLSDWQMNKSITGMVDWDGDAADFVGVRFRLDGPQTFFLALSTSDIVAVDRWACEADGGCAAPHRPEIALDDFDLTSSSIVVDWGVLMDPSPNSICDPGDECGCASRCVPGAGVAWTAMEGTSEPAVFRVE